MENPLGFLARGLKPDLVGGEFSLGVVFVFKDLEPAVPEPPWSGASPAECGWWWAQSGANPSLAKFPDNP